MISPDTAVLHEASPPESLQVGAIFETMPVTSQHLIAGIGLFFLIAIDAWEMMIIVYASPLIKVDLHLTPQQIGSLISAMFIGVGIGTFAWGPFCDRFGRRRSIVLGLILYGMLSLVSAASPNLYILFATRLAAGFCLAGVMVATYPLFEELLPVPVRGKYAVYLGAGWPAGMLLALGVTIMFGPAGWRVVLGVSSFAVLWSIFILFYVPESPYWLAAVDRQQEAKAVISRLSRGAVIVSPEQRLVVQETASGSVFQVFHPDVLRITVLQLVINFTFNWGFWGLQTWLPELLQKRGLSLPQSYDFIIISALCMLPGYAAASYLTVRYGRKSVMIGFVGVSALAGLAFANATSQMALYTFNFLLAFFSMGAFGIWNVWSSEVYPTKIRVVGVGWGLTAGRVANTIAPSVIGFLVATSSSFNQIAMFINAFLFITAILALFLPETEGRDLG